MRPVDVKYLVMEGGGTLGLAYAGALVRMEELGFKRYNMQGYGGSSAGAIAATLLAVGYTPKELQNILATTDFNDFKDDKLGFLRDLWLIITKFGMCPGNAFSDWITKKLDAKGFKPDTTFHNLYNRTRCKLHIYGTNISKGESVLFSSDTTPSMRVIEALRISMSFPFFFTAKKIDNDYYADGGILNNYPIDTFRGEPGLLGLRVDTPKEINKEKTKIRSLISYGITIVMLLHARVQDLHMQQADWDRTISINIGSEATSMDFSLSEKNISFLIEAGKQAVDKYFEV